MPFLAVAACLAPFFLQGVAMLVDEFYFHHRRRLSAWEVFGHPLDTLTVAVALAVLVFLPPSSAHLSLYVILSGFSCLFVTKDEFVHRTQCEAVEQWLHAVLFVLHPMVFLGAGLLWWHGEGTFALRGQLTAIVAFGIYQLVYWLFDWRKRALT